MTGTESCHLLGVLPDTLIKAIKEKVLTFDIGHEIANASIFCESSTVSSSDISEMFFFTEDEFPDISLISGYRPFLSQRFKERQRNGDVLRKPMELHNKEFLSLGLKDPEGYYSALCINPVVFVVDIKAIVKAGLPVPRSWFDLLNPVFSENVELKGHDLSVYDSILLQIYHKHGSEGVKKFLGVLRKGDETSEGFPIYIMPYACGRAYANKFPVSIVWPADGAIVTPLFAVIKKNCSADLEPLVRFLTGQAFGMICSRNYFPSLHPHVDSRLPGGVPLCWAGWDFLLGKNIEEILEELSNC